mmetsp:Transcript_22285/g.26804  ORF Transcript_22285/g.26804 Transcript_22285/m.26804 type:complete len:211 (-) Transcript_22285:858-1490(-)|eukprot:CAMPEP_0197850112 /NCGR_PEP_ID=MMETSP1438-20131217/14271_1 /TAXON_ID=1461541 /ORGANISM="Pterosperma sp., Strain CCMP1384" /LENGTH=210 /DNA_ID=CAMNT_0043463093 /DNA_START=270 /DNA_END=902 /DNA_ORIENTATION=+
MARILALAARKVISQGAVESFRPIVTNELRRPVAFFGTSTFSSRLGGIPPDDPEGLRPKTFDGPIDLDKEQEPYPPNAKVKRLAEELMNLTLIETADLGKVLKDMLNLPDSGMMVGGFGGPGAAAGGAEEAAGGEAAAEKTEFDVKLESFDSGSKIKVIKEVRAITGLGLKEAKALVEGAPTALKKEVGKEEADDIIAKLKAVGAVCVIE